jgi:EAL domain-containing protein (putative c-di-GMP-specific phosphodiesterase class I)
MAGDAVQDNAPDLAFARRVDTYVEHLAARQNLMLAEERGLRSLHEQLARVESALRGDQFDMVFQPIVDIRSRETCGWEALSRFERAPVRPPDQWFADADAVGFGLQLEMHAIRAALRKGGRLPAGAYLSLNASPATLLSQDFADVLTPMNGQHLVVEVTEHAAVEDYERLKRAIDRLRLSGVRLAIDDAGAGFASFKHVIHLVPEFVKLDRFLTHDIDCDPAKQALTAALVAFAARIGARLLAEGVETAEELRVLTELGVEYAQGYYLGRPGPLVA